MFIALYAIIVLFGVSVAWHFWSKRNAKVIRSVGLLLNPESEEKDVLEERLVTLKDQEHGSAEKIESSGSVSACEVSEKLEMRSSNVDGKGLFLRSDASENEVILIETPIFRYPSDRAHALTEPTAILAKFEELDPVKQNNILKHFTFTRHSGLYKAFGEDLHDIVGILATHSFSLNATNEVALLSQATFFNHSCDPSVEWTSTPTGSVQFRMSKPGKAGEELFVSYLGSIAQYGTAARRAQLLEGKGFFCKCDRCQAPDRLSPVQCDSCRARDAYFDGREMKLECSSGRCQIPDQIGRTVWDEERKLEQISIRFDQNPSLHLDPSGLARYLHETLHPQHWANMLMRIILLDIARTNCVTGISSHHRVGKDMAMWFADLWKWCDTIKSFPYEERTSVLWRHDIIEKSFHYIDQRLLDNLILINETAVADLLRKSHGEKYCYGCQLVVEHKCLECSRCHKIQYCGKKCQRQDWAQHKKACHYHHTKEATTNL